MGKQKTWKRRTLIDGIYIYIAVCWWSRWIAITQKKIIFINIREHHSSSLLTTQSNVGTMLHSVLLHVLPFDGGGIPNSEKLQVLKGWGQHWNSLMRYTLKSNSLINLNNLAVGVFIYGVPLHFFFGCVCPHYLADPDASSHKGVLGCLAPKYLATSAFQPWFVWQLGYRSASQDQRKWCTFPHRCFQQ